MEKNYFLFLLLVQSLALAGQVFPDEKRDFNWLTGYSIGPSSGVIGGAMWGFDGNNSPIINPYPINDYRLLSSNSCISDPAGDFLLSTNGFKIIGNNCQIVPNGDSLSFGVWYGSSGNEEITKHGVLILPWPAYSNAYFIFHQFPDTGLVPQGFGIWVKKLYYSTVTQDPSSGEVLVTSKNNRIVQDFLSTGFAATRHANGRDWWIIQSDWSENNFYTILLAPFGIHSVEVQQHPSPYNYLAVHNSQIAQVFSPDGQKYILSHFRPDNYGSTAGMASIRVFNFDRCTGLLSNEREYMEHRPESPVVSVAVSPNSRYLYYSETKFSGNCTDADARLYQFDLDNPDFSSTKTLVGTYDHYYDSVTCGISFPLIHQMQLGPDSNIYIESSTRWVHVVDQPDQAGTACNFKQRELLLPTFSGGSLPYFPNFRLGAVKGSLCDSLTIGITEEEGLAGAIELYPNPASGKVLLRLEGQAGQHELLLSDMTGRPLMTQVFAGQEISLDVSLLAAGVYLLSARPLAGAWVSRKLVVER